MSQERWDIVVRFVDGPLSYQGDMVCRGPVVRMGANPGPGGLRVEGYRGLDDRQAVITAYDGATVAIAPVGSNQVRVAPHANVDWAEIQAIRGPVYLDKDAVFHLGPPGRGATVLFVECRRLGVWEQQRILSEASQVAPGVQPSSVKELDTSRGVPAWFLPATAVLVLAVLTAVLIPLVGEYRREIASLGPKDEGQEYYEFVDAQTLATELPEEFRKGLNQPFADFVMGPNATKAEWPALASNPEAWDQKYLTYVQHSVKQHLGAWAFWTRLDQVVDDYALVVSQLREAGLPEIFAAIPYQESGYRSDRQSPACARGMWQFQPESGHRMGLQISGCRLRGSQGLWAPTRPVPPQGVYKNAEYIDKSEPIGSASKCRIQGCEIDERTDMQLATRAAIRMLAEAWADPVLSESGAVVQMVILSHNTGYDDGRYDDPPKSRIFNVKPAYQAYIQKNGLQRAPDFYGQNITCETNQGEDPNSRCGGFVAKETQHYAYSISAQHLLAVCYYAENYGSQGAFKDWRKYTVGDGYCTGFNVPTVDEIRKRAGKKK